MTTSSSAPLVDTFGRQVTYLRMSVTDRCDLRCTYCMAEAMTFLPKKELLTLEELEFVARAFIQRGVRKIRITGGEPLVRKGIMSLFNQLGQMLGNGLEELTLTTNATQLSQHADDLAKAHVRRVNVSLDTLNSARFSEIARRDQLGQVLDGIHAAKAAGLKVKINTVALKHQNSEEIPDIISWAHKQGHDVSLIEVMPLGETGEDRFDQYIPLDLVQQQLEKLWTLEPEEKNDPLAGPSRYFRIRETGGRVGFITPLTNNFCAGCNRVRITCTGRIYMCLGQNNHIDLRTPLRESSDPAGALDEALDAALFAKPERHDFSIRTPGQSPAVARHMSVTGG
ncbi:MULTISPECIES: GTP 3',8-cyclase MoaA [Hyphomonas]|uniref:GTP 3',8-cyclase n=1 Tax=Hyphomonas adhaerens TaxID=81029 RepID=A0A3B9GXN5_9PROT|nr:MULTISPECIES: GTP 3',8-cyclase MoaA [Hyphomonas]MBB40380.1 GTP 3',8-cyclase MoaA [Hyphomonas sp.]HAE27213.1 GTP 3',8-cyclase MoaA [Hyphomonas adhaerens]